MITKPTINYHVTRAFALTELLDVIYEQVFEAVNEGTDDPEGVLSRAKDLLHVASECATSLTHDLNDLISEAGPGTPPADSVLDPLGLGLTVIDILCGERITTIGKLTNLTESELLKLPGMGRKALNAVKKALNSRGLSLAAGGEL